MTTAATATRVQQQTPGPVNERIRESIESSVVRAATGDRRWIDRRLAELDREWDVERAIEANFASLGLAALGLWLAGRRKRWIALSLLMHGFLLQHTLQGWCPPVSVLRRLGFRTAKEIEQERYALKALRGDLDGIRRGETSPHGTAEQVLRAVRSS